MTRIDDLERAHLVACIDNLDALGDGITRDERWHLGQYRLRLRELDETADNGRRVGA